METPTPSTQRSRASRLLEALIVLMILGGLSSLVLPQFSSAARVSQETSLRDDLRYIRTQILVYRAQHGGTAPGYPDGDTTRPPTTTDFAAQMTLYTDAQGRTAIQKSEQFCFGPYLEQLPANPVNHSAAIRFIAAEALFPTVPGGSEGWFYQPATGTFAPNIEGRDAVGEPYFQY